MQRSHLVFENFDHKVIYQKIFTGSSPMLLDQENFIKWNVEPTAENMLTFIKNTPSEKFKGNIKLVRLKLFETKDSYPEWINDTTFNMY